MRQSTTIALRFKMEVGPATPVSHHELPDEELSWMNLLMLWILMTSLLGHIVTLTTLWWRCCSSSPTPEAAQPPPPPVKVVTRAMAGQDWPRGQLGLDLTFPNSFSRDPRRRQTASESDKEKALKEQKRQKTDKVEIKVDLTDSEHEIDKTSLPGQEHQEEHEMAELNDTFPDEDLGKDLKDLLSEEAVSNEGSKTEKREKRGFSLLNFIPNSGWFAPSPGKSPSTSPMRLSPKRTKKDLHNKQKDKLALAVKEANKLKARNFKHPPIKELFSSSSAKASKSSKRRTTTILLETLAGEGRGLPLTTDLLMALASSLKAGGYKAGEGYTAEAKLLHIEEGYQWTDQLDRVFKQCKRALERGRGPRKKAKEVNQEMRRHPKKLSLGQAAKVVKFPALLFVFAMNWMLREIELAAVMTEHIIMNYQNKQVSLRLEVSKTDQEGSGIMRTLQCLCGEKKCHPECPFWVASEVLRVIEHFNGTNSPICLTAGKNVPKKNQIISAWCGLYGKGVTGHSARRSGALGYIRSGWTITQTAYLGRWKSSAILSYAEEALETMPANLGDPNVAKFESRKDGKTNLGEVDVVEYTTWKDMVNRELKAIKKDNENQSTELAETMEFWKHIAKTQEGKLPSKVICRSTGVIHYNAAKVAASPPFTWRSLCGWAYYGGNFMFESETTTPTCAKCLNLHATQRGGVGTS